MDEEQTATALRGSAQGKPCMAISGLMHAQTPCVFVKLLLEF
jgi:hypothetical protein